MKVPGHVIDGRGSPFPQGVYQGQLTQTQERKSRDSKGTEGANLWFDLVWGSMTPIDGQDVGNRPYRQSIAVIYEGQYLVDLETIDDSTPFLLQRAAGTTAQLAIAFGATGRGEDGSTEFNVEAFLEDLRNGAYNGQKAIIDIRHRPSKKAGGRVFDEATYSPVQPAVSATARAETPPPSRR